MLVLDTSRTLDPSNNVQAITSRKRNSHRSLSFREQLAPVKGKRSGQLNDDSIATGSNDDDYGVIGGFTDLAS